MVYKLNKCLLPPENKQIKEATSRKPGHANIKTVNQLVIQMYYRAWSRSIMSLKHAICIGKFLAAK